jgi:fructose-1-phosphate kinase PfkB-like protein
MITLFLFLPCRCSSFNINSADIVDTTGAGDAFIGGFLFGTMQRFSLQVFFMFEQMNCEGSQ